MAVSDDDPRTTIQRHLASQVCPEDPGVDLWKLVTEAYLQVCLWFSYNAVGAQMRSKLLWHMSQGGRNFASGASSLQHIFGCAVLCQEGLHFPGLQELFNAVQKAMACLAVKVTVPNVEPWEGGTSPAKRAVWEGHLLKAVNHQLLHNRIISPTALCFFGKLTDLRYVHGDYQWKKPKQLKQLFAKTKKQLDQSKEDLNTAYDRVRVTLGVQAVSAAHAVALQSGDTVTATLYRPGLGRDPISTSFYKCAGSNSEEVATGLRKWLTELMEQWLEAAIGRPFEEFRDAEKNIPHKEFFKLIEMSGLFLGYPSALTLVTKTGTTTAEKLDRSEAPRAASPNDDA